MASDITIRRFAPGDYAAVLAFAEPLPEHDLLFLGRDLRHPRVIEAWSDAIARDATDGLVAERDGRVVAAAALLRDPHGWSAHVGEVRLLVAPDARGRGLGRRLLDRCLEIAGVRGLAKLTARMTPDHAAALTLFADQGFRREAVLTGQVKGSDGVAHDIVILSLDLEREAIRRAAFG